MMKLQKNFPSILSVSLALFILPACAEQDGKKEEAKDKEKVVKKEGALPQVLISTTLGDITVELDEKKAPNTVKNFLSYVDSKHYSDTVFHRVISGFMIQGGGFTETPEQLIEKKVGEPIKNEADNGLSNTRGTIAMARTGDPHSATAQFYINVVDNKNLDHKDKISRWGYAVFGKVTKGMDVVDKIRNVKTGHKALSMNRPGGGAPIIAPSPDVPLKPVTIKSITRVGK